MKNVPVSILALLTLLNIACYNKNVYESSLRTPSLNKNFETVSSQKMIHNQKFIDALVASRKSWENLKRESNNTYSYLLESGIPGFAQNSYQTIIEVEQGIIADYTLRPINGSISDGMRKHSPPRKTLDELYDECEKEIIPNLRDDQWFVLEFFANGVLASCNYDTCGLQDTEGKGIDIRAIAFERTKNFGLKHRNKKGELEHSCKWP